MLPSYLELKWFHVSCAAISLSLFLLRGIWALSASPQLQRRWVKILPHVIDTLFLASGIALAITIHQYPFVNSWLTAKVLGLVAYVILGSFALKRARSVGGRGLALLAALAVFAYIVGVAITHNPRSWSVWAG